MKAWKIKKLGMLFILLGMIQSPLAESTEPTKPRYGIKDFLKDGKVEIKKHPGRMCALLLATVGLLSMPHVPAFTNDISGWWQGRAHLGYSIFLDADRVEALLSPDELKLVKSKADEVAIAEMFSKKILGNYDFEHQSRTFLP